MSREIKVLHVGEYVQGGVATYLKTLLEDKNTQVKNYLLYSDYKSEHNWNIPTEQVFFYDYHRSLLAIPRAMYDIHRKIKEIKPDIIYCHSTWAGLFVRFPLLLKKRNYSVLYNAHGWAFSQKISGWKKKLYAAIERMLAIRTDIIINVSQNEYDDAVKYGINPNRMVVIYSGISAEKISCCSEVKLPEHKINILFVGRFDPQKGIDILLEEFSKCTRKDLFLTVIGDCVIKTQDFKTQYEQDNIQFLGWVEHDKIASFYQEADVVVMPSRWEAFGLVAIEAMKYGTPVIVSDQGALKELVKNNVNGYVFSLKNGELTKIFQSLNKEKLSQLGENAEKVFMQRYQAGCMLEKTMNYYKKTTDLVLER